MAPINYVKLKIKLIVIYYLSLYAILMLNLIVCFVATHGYDTSKIIVYGNHDFVSIKKALFSKNINFDL